MKRFNIVGCTHDFTNCAQIDFEIIQLGALLRCKSYADTFLALEEK